MKPKTLLIVLAVALAISGIVLYFIKKAEQAKKDAALQGDVTTPKNVVPGTIKPPAPVSNSDYPIIYNKYSYSAKPIQEALGFKGANVDGIIGKNTVAALNKYWQGVTTRFTIPNETERDSIVKTIKVARQKEIYFGFTR